VVGGEIRRGRLGGNWRPLLPNQIGYVGSVPNTSGSFASYFWGCDSIGHSAQILRCPLADGQLRQLINTWSRGTAVYALKAFYPDRFPSVDPSAGSQQPSRVYMQKGDTFGILFLRRVYLDPRHSAPFLDHTDSHLLVTRYL
jgi:hypothetical protein